MIIHVSDNILLFYQQLLDDPNHRYRSWEHCYSHFQKHQRSIRKDEDIENATLHLAFFLASWGMYRGSSQLLQKDYRVHTPVVRELLNDRYASLWQMDFNSTSAGSLEIELLFQLVKKLRQIYTKAHVSPTDTLITKTLLGTLCCTPAYDQLFITGVKTWNRLREEYEWKFPAKFGRNSYRGLIEFYRQNREGIEAAQAVIAQHGIRYPIMKLIDMYFWNLGYQLSKDSDGSFDPMRA